MSELGRTSKPVVATGDEVRLTEAYAVLKEVRFYLRQGRPLPKLTADVRTVVEQWVEDYDAAMAGRVARTMAAGDVTEVVMTALEEESGGRGEQEKRGLGEEGKDWQPMETAPKYGKRVQMIDEDGRVYPDAHWAQDLSGEEQPAFSGWFYQSGKYTCSEIRKPKGWKPLEVGKEGAGDGC